MSDKPTLLFAGWMTAPRAQLLADTLTTDWRVLTWHDEDPYDVLTEYLAEADAMVAGRLSGDWPPMPKLKLYQLPFNGYSFIQPQDLPRGCTLCNVFGHEIAVAEYVLAAMLEREIGIGPADRHFRRYGWDNVSPGGGPDHGELYGKTLGIVGYGKIGMEVARRADVFGMRCIAVSRTVNETPPPLARLDDMDGLGELLSESDYVLISVPLSDETEGMIDSTRLAQMKPTGTIINVGRGHVIEEAALYYALAESRIGGAIIDVWYDYLRDAKADQLPSRYPFQELDNVVMTPHFSAHTAAMRARRWTNIATNLDRLARSEPLQDVCFEGTG